MILERTRYIGRHEIIFSVTRFTVAPGDQESLQRLCLLEAKTSLAEVRSRLVELHEKVLARDLPCVMTVVVSKPLTRQQGDLLNNQRQLIESVIADAIAAPMGMVSDQAGRMVAKVVGEFVGSKLRNYHAGDVIVGFDAQVRGGIGPQRSASSMVMYAQGSDA
ncbi:hypothetical protein [Pseudomonas sp. C3-2018]|uniref:hypothetical protein n=1 Tax=Pseudomonas sp. C3-2018 TaxID=2898587 RepID=UPI001E621688|nr:hypothetical protein [Pseudomonas sp. C3-2018]MCD4531030.1 hypothetical protein [Pseudomonas sp. C3-2018]